LHEASFLRTFETRLRILPSPCATYSVRISLTLKLAKLLFALTTKAIIVAASCWISIVERDPTGVLRCSLAVFPIFIVFLGHSESLAFLSDLISLLNNCRNMVAGHYRVAAGVSEPADATFGLLEEV